MKHHSKHRYLYFILVLFLFACFLMASYIAELLLGNNITVTDLIRQAAISFVGIIFFILLGLFFYLLPHRKVNYKMETHRLSHHEFINDIEEAIDKISRGNFEIQLDNIKYEGDKHIYEHFNELADKINHMAKELGEMEMMRQDFVSNVSHEIQSPLTSIRGFVSLLKDDSLSKHDRFHYIAVIESESRRLSKLSENLLRLSILEDEFTEFNPKAYTLNRQLKNVILLLEPQWSEKEIDISLRGEIVDIFADEDLINQVWINLLNNSIKFTPNGGAVTVSVSSDNKLISVTISDSGIGMSEEILLHIFERFYMADKARSRSVGGSGLGLSIVKRIVQIYHGTIDVESKPGEGTAFKVTIPKNSL